MEIKEIIYEDFVNYKKPSMYIGTARCGGKCCIEAGIPLSVCQNDEWRKTATVVMADDTIINRYLSNDITSAICFAGLEPFEQFAEMFNLISKLRNEYRCNDTVIIYTGYYKEEIQDKIDCLKIFPNIIVKFGRFLINSNRKYDDVLGVTLASSNQYAEVIS